MLEAVESEREASPPPILQLGRTGASRDGRASQMMVVVKMNLGVEFICNSSADSDRTDH
jgi:hypothetical protein